MVPRCEPEANVERIDQLQHHIQINTPKHNTTVVSARRQTPVSTTITTATASDIRPDNPRRSTDPGIARPPQVHLTTDYSSSHIRTRARSPYSRGHPRSRSTSTPSSAVTPLARAHSLPTVYTTTSRPLSSSYGSSPARSPKRLNSPFRPSEDSQTASTMPLSLYDGGFEIIAEDSELDLSQRPPPDRLSHPSPLYSALNSARTVASRRQRPTSPLQSLNTVSIPTPSSSSASSPSFPPAKFNEAYPTLHHYASNSSFSSMPSTPTSARSRSPSISSLDTIEDAPDLEGEAMEAERIAKLSAVAEEEEEDDEETEDPRRRSSLDIPSQRVGAGFGFGRGLSGRKRWSICGGERRADLDLETIWED